MILFDRVTKSYPRTTRPALDDVSLEVERGEFAFVVGQSGSGKSTLLRLALREEVATAGRVLVAGRDLARLPERKVPILRREIGVVFQDFRLLPGKDVYQNVAFALQVIGTSRSTIRQTVPETLAMVGLEGKEKRLPHELSGGEQQRVAIARAVVNKPAILLCDEPTGNLDPATSLDIVALLERINRSGTTIVMATHDDEIVNSFRKRVIELQLGQLQRDQRDAGYGVTGSVMPAVAPRTPGGHLGSWVDPDSVPPASGAEEGDDDLVAASSVAVGAVGAVGASDLPDAPRPARRRLSLRRS